MADFNELLIGSPEALLKIFYRVRTNQQDGFVTTLNKVAEQVGVNQHQLICGLGFNPNLAEMPDVLSLLGFSSHKLLQYRRDELFVNDTYEKLNIDDILEIYTQVVDEPTLCEQLRVLLPRRLALIQQVIHGGMQPNKTISYKMELHAIYSSEIASESFVQNRITAKQALSPSAQELWRDEIKLIVNNHVIPPSNLFFSDALSPEDKLILIESGEINISMIKNRMQNTAISAEERDMLEDHLK